MLCISNLSNQTCEKLRPVSWLVDAIPKACGIAGEAPLEQGFSTGAFRDAGGRWDCGS